MVDTHLVDSTVSFVLDLLRGATTTSEEIDGAIAKVAPIFQGDEESLNLLRRLVEERVVIHTAAPTMLSKDHRPWLDAARGDYDWDYSERYHTYLRTSVGLPPSVVGTIDESTDKVLDFLEAPGAQSSWDRRGLVVGQVQSGKTAHYLGLAAKALDVGFKVVLVLAGADNDLRAQTQKRLEEALTGWDTMTVSESDGKQSRTPVGVGLLKGQPHLPIRSLTSRALDGDFKTAKSSVLGMIGNDPLVLVVKKNKSVLQNVLRWLRAGGTVAGDGDSDTVYNAPLIMIDDEADHFSVNTAEADSEDATAINTLVRQILHTFSQSAYVGYTATAFANIFVALTDAADSAGETLFPRDFILNMKPPTNYLGAERVFGLDDPSVEREVDALPIVKDITDSEDWLPSKHKITHPVSEVLPDSLKRAIDSFVLSTSARRARGHRTSHNTMLVHVTRFNAVQSGVADAIREHVKAMRRRMRHGEGGADVERLRRLWDSEYVTITERFLEHPDLGEHVATSWDAVQTELRHTVESIAFREVNGSKGEVLDYDQYSDTGLTVIAVGGNKLSRGLTLEGLTVSYYLRPAQAYDTLLQMGRWFGFRPGYADLCRLFTTPVLRRWYRDITAANAELLRDLDSMAAQGATPERFGLRVRTHPDGLLVSARNKVRTSAKINQDYSRTAPEVIAFNVDREVREECLRVADELLTAVEQTGGLVASADTGPVADLDLNLPRSGRHVWVDVPGEIIRRFLSDFPTNPEARRARTDLMADYVEDRLGKDELTSWTVIVVDPQDIRDLRTLRPLAGLKVAASKRAADVQDGGGSSDDGFFRIKTVLGSEDEVIGMTGTELQRAGELEDGGLPRQSARRAARGAAHGVLHLLLIEPPDGDKDDPFVAMKVSFPGAEDLPAGRSYLVGEVYKRLVAGEDDE